jgi:hypothetical protein
VLRVVHWIFPPDVAFDQQLGNVGYPLFAQGPFLRTEYAEGLFFSRARARVRTRAPPILLIIYMIYCKGYILKKKMHLSEFVWCS